MMNVAFETPGPAEHLAAQFEELPGLRLTPRQAARLLGVDWLVTESVVNALLDAAFLRRLADGTLVRADR
jgi:hypothetical protein